MIEINGNRFAKNDSEFTESLFNPPKTCFGFYKRKGKNVIIFCDIQKKPFAALVKQGTNSFLVNCREVTGGQIFYQFALGENYESIFGLNGLGYTAQNELVENLVNRLITNKESRSCK